MTELHIAAISVVLFAAILGMMEVGRQIGRQRIRQKWTEPAASFAAAEGAIFGLMGLMIAFTFSMAASRFEMRRQLAVEETNDIGTAWRRLDLLPKDRQPALREDFRRYVDARLAVYRDVRNAAAVKEALIRTQELQDDIWSHAVIACDEASSFAVTHLVLASLNTMIDITTTRTIIAQTHLPWLICAFLIASPLLCGVAAGLDAAPAPRRSLVHTLGFALILSITVFVILDLDYPRVGLVRLDVFDQALVELRNSMR